MYGYLVIVNSADGSVYKALGINKYDISYNSGLVITMVLTSSLQAVLMYHDPPTQMTNLVCFDADTLFVNFMF